MVEFKLKESDGRLYLPKEIREAILENGEARAIPSFRGILLFRPSSEYQEIIESLEIIMADIKHRARVEEKIKRQRDEGQNFHHTP